MKYICTECCFNCKLETEVEPFACVGSVYVNELMQAEWKEEKQKRRIHAPRGRRKTLRKRAAHAYNSARHESRAENNMQS